MTAHKLFSKAMICAMLGASLLVGVATPADADRDDECRRDIRKAEEKVEKAVRKHANTVARPSNVAASSKKPARTQSLAGTPYVRSTDAVKDHVYTVARQAMNFVYEVPMLVINTHR